jgi:hypothetical protein
MKNAADREGTLPEQREGSHILPATKMKAGKGGG